MKNELVYTDIYTTYSPKILHYLDSTFPVEDAEDLLQEIFIKVLHSLPTFKQECSINTWVFKIATRTMIDRLRNKKYAFTKAHSSLDTGDRTYNNSALTVTFSTHIEKKEMVDCIRQFINELSEKNKIVFVLSEYEGFSNAEIAEILQITIDSVKIRLHRAKESLKGVLKKNCHIYFDEGSEIACEPK